MTATDHQLIAIAFDDDEPARALIRMIDALGDAHHLDVYDTVLLRSADDGVVRVDDTLEVSPVSAGLRGGFGGLILGALIGVPILGLAFGAASAAVVAKIADLGIPKDFIAELAALLTPNRIIVAVLADVHDPTPVLAALAEISGGTVVAGNLPADAMAAVDDAVAGYRWDQQ